METECKFHRAAVVLQTIKRSCIAYNRLEAYCYNSSMKEITVLKDMELVQWETHNACRQCDI